MDILPSSHSVSFHQFSSTTSSHTYHLILILIHPFTNLFTQPAKGVILRDWNFVLLFLAFSFSTGVSWVFLAVVGQLIGPCGYNITVVSGMLSCS